MMAPIGTTMPSPIPMLRTAPCSSAERTKKEAARGKGGFELVRREWECGQCRRTSYVIRSAGDRSNATAVARRAASAERTG